MKALTKSQQDILNNMSILEESDLGLDTPFNIARKPLSHIHLFVRNHEQIIFVRGYVQAAEGLRQRGLLMRDSNDFFYYLTSFGIEYIKGLQS